MYAYVCVYACMYACMCTCMSNDFIPGTLIEMQVLRATASGLNSVSASIGLFGVGMLVGSDASDLSFVC